jgi:hypothetical protein
MQEPRSTRSSWHTARVLAVGILGRNIGDVTDE